MLKCDKFNDDKELHSSKRLFIDVTNEVLKLEISSKVKFVHEVNIARISVTCDVSKFDKFIDFNNLHP